MRTIITITITILATLFLVALVTDIKKNIEQNRQVYEKTKNFLEECVATNGIYAEAQTGKDERTMICTKQDLKTKTN